MKIGAAQRGLKQDPGRVSENESEDRNSNNEAGGRVRNLTERAMGVFRLARCPGMMMENLYRPKYQQQQNC